MTREESVKAMERLDRYFRTVLEDDAYSLATMGFNGIYREAWIMTCEQITLDDLDKQSRTWFIEDEDEFEEAFIEIIEDYAKAQKFSSMLIKNMELIEDND